MAYKPIKTIIDHIGRTVVGVLKKEDTKSITLFNPVIIHVQPDPQSGQLQVQSFFCPDLLHHLPNKQYGLNYLLQSLTFPPSTLCLIL